MHSTKINWDKVSEVLSQHKLPSFDEEITIDLVNRAVDQWLEDDEKFFDVVDVERRVEVQQNGLTKKAFIDLYGDLDSLPSIVDWKVRVGEFTENWKSRLSRSEQGLYYVNLLVSNHDIVPQYFQVQFRAIATKGTERTWQDTTVYHAKDLIEYNRRERRWDSLQKDQLSYGLAQEWAEDRNGCLKFGPPYPCEFMDMCLRKAPKPTPPAGMKFNLSYSTEQEFKRCPERARLVTITKNLKEHEEEPSQAPRIGTAFHAVMAEIYRQVYCI